MRFNGVDPREISPRLFPAKEIINSIPPRSLRTLDTLGGPIYVGTQLSGRQITVTINVAGMSHDHANELVQLLNSYFVTDEPAELEPTHLPGKAFTAILQDAGTLEWTWGFGTVDYTFFAPRPYMHSTAETVIRFTGLQRRLEPRGTVPIRPVIMHTMGAAASALTLSIDGVQFFRLRPLSGTFPQGSILLVDIANRLVKINGTTSMLLVDYTASDWHPDIRSGCLLGVSDTGETEVRWRDEWM